MNPIFALLNAPVATPQSPTPRSQPVPWKAPLDPATTYDRAYIAAHERCFHHNPDIVTYDRSPLPQEWPIVPNGGFVRVFVINEYTTVRVLHTLHGERVGEPVLDSWRGYEDENN